MTGRSRYRVAVFAASAVMCIAGLRAAESPRGKPPVATAPHATARADKDAAVQRDIEHVRRAEAGADMQRNPPQLATESRSSEAKNGVVEHLRAALVLDYATFLVAVVTAIFAVFLATFGILEWIRFENLRKKLKAQKKELTEERQIFETRLRTFKSEIDLKEQAFDARLGTFKSEIDLQEQRVAANQRFLEAVLSHHSNLLVGIVESFGTALQPDEARRLASQIFEAEAALDLFYPDKDEVLKALLRLEQIGGDGAVSSLIRLRDDSDADPKIRIRAQQVLYKILERLKKERQEAAFRRESPSPPRERPESEDSKKDGAQC